MHCCFGFCLLEIKTANIHRKTTGSLVSAIKRAPADHDTQICCMSPILVLIFDIFHELYFVDIQDLGWIIIRESITNVTKCSSKEEQYSVDHKINK